MVTADKIVNSLWNHLDDRQQEILSGRFGFGKYDEAQTLATLGSKYGITRERVRQIETGALQSLRSIYSSHPEVVEFAARSRKYLKNSGGLAHRGDFFKYHQSFLENLRENHLDLLLETSTAFCFYPEDKDFWPFFYSDAESMDKAKEFIAEWVSVLKPRKDEMLSPENYASQFSIFVRRKKLNPAHAENYVKVSKKFHRNSYGDIGLSEWPEVKPETIRDYIYIVLRKEKKPLHFVEIAKIINDRGSAKKALNATVHNELIKDPRFVLVGRGIYGLSEHGYRPGTAREVIKAILGEKGPMRTREIIDAVQKERFFKPNTVLVNLQNKNYFVRRHDGTYQAKK